MELELDHVGSLVRRGIDDRDAVERDAGRQWSDRRSEDPASDLLRFGESVQDLADDRIVRATTD